MISWIHRCEPVYVEDWLCVVSFFMKHFCYVVRFPSLQPLANFSFHSWLKAFKNLGAWFLFMQIFSCPWRPSCRLLLCLSHSSVPWMSRWFQGSSAVKLSLFLIFLPLWDFILFLFPPSFTSHPSAKILLKISSAMVSCYLSQLIGFQGWAEINMCDTHAFVLFLFLTVYLWDSSCVFSQIWGT